MRDYQRLETREGEVNRGTSEVYYSPPPMTILHKFAFVISILFCISVVVSFLWFLPCNSNTCPAPKLSRSIPWEKTLAGLELYGGVHVVGGKTLVIRAKAARWGKSQFPPPRAAVVGLSSSSGNVLWWLYLPSTPIHLTCPPHEPPSCFVLVPPASLEAFSAESGIFTWKASNESWKSLSVPVMVPSDRKDEFDFAAIVRLDNRSQVVIVSGRTGKVNEIPIPDKCKEASNITFEQTSAKLYYTCTLAGEVSLESVPLKGVMTRNSFKNKKNKKTKRNEGAKDKKEGSEVEGHTVEYRNVGQCPEDCSVDLQVRDSLGNNLLWSLSSKNAFVMSPLPMRFKPNLMGFLIKLWQWKLPVQINESLRVETVKERIMLITFDRELKYINVMNASQTDVTRLCNSSQPLDCQPSINSNTALIADLTGDGLQELVSYYVSYNDVEGVGWQLESCIRVVLLENELSKIYETTSH